MSHLNVYNKKNYSNVSHVLDCFAASFLIISHFSKSSQFCKGFLPKGGGGEGGYSIVKHTGGLARSSEQNPKNIYPRIVILENAKFMPPKYFFKLKLCWAHFENKSY